MSKAANIPVRQPAGVVLAAHGGRIARYVESLLCGEALARAAARAEVTNAVDRLRQHRAYIRQHTADLGWQYRAEQLREATMKKDEMRRHSSAGASVAVRLRERVHAGCTNIQP